MKKDGYILRSLEVEDYDRGFIRCLNELTIPVNITKKQFETQFSLVTRSGNYRIVVAYDPGEDRIIGTGTLFVEQKFIRGCARKGHIEDVVVLEEKRGLGIGKEIVRTLMDISKSIGCYKTALVCDPKNVEFYKRCGLTEKEREMIVYH